MARSGNSSGQAGLWVVNDIGCLIARLLKALFNSDSNLSYGSEESAIEGAKEVSQKRKLQSLIDC